MCQFDGKMATEPMSVESPLKQEEPHDPKASIADTKYVSMLTYDDHYIVLYSFQVDSNSLWLQCVL